MNKKIEGFIQDLIPGLIGQLKDKSRDTRYGATQTLWLLAKGGRIKKRTLQRAIDPLIGALRDNDGDVRRCAVWALGAIGGPAIELLISALQQKKSKRLRRGAAQALLEIAGKPLLNKRFLSPAVDPLIDALKDKDLSVRSNAALALGAIGDLRALSGIKTLLRHDPEPNVRFSAKVSLGELNKLRPKREYILELKTPSKTKKTSSKPRK